MPDVSLDRNPAAKSNINPRLERLRAAILSATDGLTQSELGWHPEGKWNIAEILEHLSLTYTSTVKVFERCLTDGKTAKKPTPKDRIGAFVVTGLGYLPGRRESPGFALPKGTSVDEVLPRIAQALIEMNRVIDECESRYGRRACVVDHVVLGPLTAEEWRKFHWVHGRHHIRQILSRRAMSRTT